jgi:hypothetical protein
MNRTREKIREEMSYAGAEAEKNIRNVIFRRMKKRQGEIALLLAEKTEARHKPSSAYGNPGI